MRQQKQRLLPQLVPKKKRLDDVRGGSHETRRIGVGTNFSLMSKNVNVAVKVLCVASDLGGRAVTHPRRYCGGVGFKTNKQTKDSSSFHYTLPHTFYTVTFRLVHEVTFLRFCISCLHCFTTSLLHSAHGLR